MSHEPPMVWRGVQTLPPMVKEFVQSAADYHYANGSDEAELSTDHYPICASRGAVRPHTDDLEMEAIGKRIFGLVVRSDGHHLHSLSLGDNSIALHEGDVYSLDPFDRHWTTCPSGDSELTFVCTFLAPADPRYNDIPKIAHDLMWETIKASVDAKREKRDEAENDRVRYRGIEPIA